MGLRLRRRVRPFEPDPGNAGEGSGQNARDFCVSAEVCAFSPHLDPPFL